VPQVRRERANISILLQSAGGRGFGLVLAIDFVCPRRTPRIISRMLYSIRVRAIRKQSHNNGEPPFLVPLRLGGLDSCPIATY
jgi:hypothetical protein